jgi:hypothetical protein
LKRGGGGRERRAREGGMEGTILTNHLTDAFGIDP